MGEKDEKSKPPILKQTKMGVNLKLYFELNDIMARESWNEKLYSNFF